MERKSLLDRAKALLPFCHCPYSGYRVAAVLEDDCGGLHFGVNVENASLGLSICAERAALASAVSSGRRSFSRILIHSPEGTPMPCGACRQVLREFCGEDFEVLVAGGDGDPASCRLGDLLPCGFRLEPGSGSPDRHE